jgi:hypothetical protein
MAQALAGRFQLPTRDVLHLLRTEFRQMRTHASAELAEEAASEEELIEHDGADEPETSGLCSDGGGVQPAATC